MNYRVDVNYEYKEVKSKLFRLSLLFALLLTIIIISDILLVTLSKENYVPFMIISMVITILFSWFSIFFFSNIYSDVNARYRYFKGYESGLKPTDEVELLQISHEPCYMNGLIVYPLFVKFISTLRSEDKIIYRLEEKINFEIGDKLTITTYQRILLSAEKHK